MDNVNKELSAQYESRGFLRGMNKGISSRQIQLEEAELLLNVRWRKGKWVTDTGGAFVEDDLDVVIEFDGIPQAIFEHRMQNGVIETILITTTTAYRKNGADWDQLDDDAAVPLVLNGETEKRVTATSLPFNDYLVFTNQIDNVKVFDPSDLQVKELEDLPGSNFPANTKANCVLSYDSSLLVFGTSEGGTPFPQRVRYCDKGDVTEWVTGVAGASDLLGNSDPIIAAEIVGPYVAIYRTRLISRMEIINTATQRFFIDDVVPNAPVLSANAAFKVEDVNYVFGANKLFKYRGGQDIEVIGAQIEEELFEEIDSALLSQCYIYYDTTRKEVWFVYPTKDLDTVDILSPDYEITYKVFRFHILSQTWAKRTFDSLEIHCIGRTAAAAADAPVTWENAVGTWSQQTGVWNDIILQEGAPAVFMGVVDKTDDIAKMIRYDYLTPLDGTYDIIPVALSKEFKEGVQEIFLDFFEYEFQGGDHTTSAILTNGEEVVFDVVPSDTEFNLPMIRLSPGVTSRSYQLKWQGTGEAGFSIGDVAINHRPESEN